jgi:two-component system response regulator HydG
LLGRGAEVSFSDLPSSVVAPALEGGPRFEGPVLSLEELSRRYARWAIAQLGGRKMLTAEKLDIDRKTLARFLEDGADESGTSGEADAAVR